MLYVRHEASLRRVLETHAEEVLLGVLTYIPPLTCFPVRRTVDHESKEKVDKATIQNLEMQGAQI